MYSWEQDVSSTFLIDTVAMESQFIISENTTESALEGTVELPARALITADDVDVLLPAETRNWRGPALQGPSFNAFNRTADSFVSHDDDMLLPPSGMIRAVNTQYNAAEPVVKSEKIIRSYARRSSRRGWVYTLLFLAVLAVAAGWAALHFNAIPSGLFDSFKH